MEREPIITQYHQLREYLNRANKVSNQKTQLVFRIEQTELFEYQLSAILQNQFETHRLVLATRDRRRNWERAGFSKFQQLEEYCAYVLNNFEQENNEIYRPLKISDLVAFEMAQKLQDKLKMLLLNKYYEP